MLTHPSPFPVPRARRFALSIRLAPRARRLARPLAPTLASRPASASRTVIMESIGPTLPRAAFVSREQRYKVFKTHDN